MLSAPPRRRSPPRTCPGRPPRRAAPGRPGACGHGHRVRACTPSSPSPRRRASRPSSSPPPWWCRSCWPGRRPRRAVGALAGAPRFFAGVAEHPPGHFPPSTVLNIYRSATGRVVATAQLPKPDHVFAAVARLGRGRTYVAAAMTSFRGCRTQLYRFSIDSRGLPSELTPLSVPQVTGSVMELVGSADGNVLAYTASGRCAPPWPPGGRGDPPRHPPGHHLAIPDGQDDIRQRVADRGRLGARFRGRHRRPLRAGGCMGPAHQFAVRPTDQPCPESAAREHRCVPGRPQQHRFASVRRDAVGTSRGRGGTRPVQHHHGQANPAAGPVWSPGARPWPSCPSAWTRPTGTCWCTATTTSTGWR